MYGKLVNLRRKGMLALSSTSAICSTRRPRQVPKDYTEAGKWYRKAAEQGHASAQFNLGCAYASGRGLPQDYAEAVKWYRKAAEADSRAQNNLAYATTTGRECHKTTLKR